MVPLVTIQTMRAFGVLNIGNTFTNGLLDSTVQGSTNGTIDNAVKIQHGKSTNNGNIGSGFSGYYEGGLLLEKVISSYVSY